jgi:hypothetical protein
MRTTVTAVSLLSISLVVAACEQQKPPQQQQQAPQPQKTQSGGAPFAYANVPTMPKAADGADGSGCLSDSGPLPDGMWFGYVRAWTATSLDLDPACVYSGAEAAKVAAAHNEESPPPNDFFVANDSAAVRTIPRHARQGRQHRQSNNHLCRHGRQFGHVQQVSGRRLSGVGGRQRRCGHGSKHAVFPVKRVAVQVAAPLSRPQRCLSVDRGCCSFRGRRVRG